MNADSETVLNLLYTIRPETDFPGSSDFLNDGLLDSFDIVMLVSALDETFGISIQGADIVPENFNNMGSIRSLIEKYVKNELRQ